MRNGFPVRSCHIEIHFCKWKIWYAVAKELENQSKKRKVHTHPLITEKTSLPLVLVEKNQTSSGHGDVGSDLAIQQAALRKVLEEAHVFERIAILLPCDSSIMSLKIFPNLKLSVSGGEEKKGS